MLQTPTAPPVSTGPNPLQQRILKVAREIEQLAGSGLPAQQFFAQFLEKVVSVVSARAGAIWLLNQGQFQLCCDVGLRSTGIQQSPEAMRFQQRLLSKVTLNGQSQLVRTQDEPQADLNEQYLLVLAPLRANGVCRGAVQIFQRPDVPTAARPGYLQFVEQMTGYASLFLERAQAASSAAVVRAMDAEITRFGLELQRSLLLQGVASVAANDGRLLVGCDRVSVILQRGQKIQVHAVSGQDSINHRASLVKSTVLLSREVIRSGVAIKYTGETDTFPPQVKERLADLVQESGARMVFVMPLRAPAPLVAIDPIDHRPLQPGPVFGCLMLEQFGQSEPTQQLTDRLDLLTSYAAASLHNARTYQSTFLLPLWRTLGQAADWLNGRKLVRALAAASAIAVAVCMLLVLKMDFRVEAKGRLMPVQRREIFVPYDAEVVDVLVSSGARVEAGQLLVKLRNNELRSDLIATESLCEEKRKLLSALQAERDDAIHGTTGERANRIQGELAKAEAELRGLERQLQVLQERERKLNIASPIAGVICTFEVDRLLKHRPVRRGEILLEVMNDAGPWQLELNVSEHRTGHLFRAQEASLAAVPIEYLLVTAPEQTHRASLKEVGTRVAISEDNRPIVEVLAALGDDRNVARRIGAEVRAKLHCGRACVGYVLFGDVIEFVQTYLWL